MSFQEPAYDYYELNPVWTLKNIVFMLAGPRPSQQGTSADPPWARVRDKARSALMGAIKNGELIPINKEWLEGSLKDFQSGKYGPGFETETYESVELERDDVIVWIFQKRIIETLQEQGHQVPGKTFDLIEKIKGIDQIKLPDFKADDSESSRKSMEGIFPAPEDSRWQDVHFTIEKGGLLKIKVKRIAKTLILDDINRYFPQNQQRDLLIRMIGAPGGALESVKFKELGNNAYKNRKNIVSKLRKTLRELFEINDDPIIFDEQNESYKVQFGAHSEWASYGPPDEFSHPDSNS